MELFGNYVLDVMVGEHILPISAQMIQELTVVSDIDRLVPTFTLTVKDATGLLGEIIPFDSESNRITIRFSRSNNMDDMNEFQFVVMRRRPLEDKSFSIEGVLDVPLLFSENQTRTLSGNIKTNLANIAADELKVDEIEIGESLNYDKVILQPSWTNAYLFRYLRERLVGKGDVGCFYTFIKNVRRKRIFVFKAIDELFLADVGRNKFIVGANPYEDYTPVCDFRIFDNSGLLSHLTGKAESYNYFDYESGEYSSSSVPIEDCPSLCDYYLVDNDNDIEVDSIKSLGSSNGFTDDFSGDVRNKYYKVATGFINMWISTWGVENLSPGDIVQVLFAEAFAQDNLAVFQHSGTWMVKRVVHVIQASFMTNILLTRCGIDTAMDTSLIPAMEVRTHG